MQQKIEWLQAQLGDLMGKNKDTSSVSDTRNPLSQKLENENVELEFQVLNYARENAHLKATYKNLFDSISVSRAQTKTIIASLQNELQSNIYKNAKLRTQLFKKVSDQKDNTQDTSKNTKFIKQPIMENLPKVGKTNALSNPVTSNSVSTPQEPKSVNNDKVIAPGMFRINPDKTSREAKKVPNTVRANNKTKPITLSQPPVITKKDVNSDLNGLSSTGVDNTKTRRPQPRSNTKNDRVPSASKSSRSKNKEAEVKKHHRNLLLYKNSKHVSSACNNIKIGSQDGFWGCVSFFLSLRVCVLFSGLFIIMASKFRSNADHTRLISKSIFITNFPEVTSSKDLWNLCQSYGTVVDVFIPYHTSKAWKRFTFVRFSKVNTVDRLVENLCTLWIGRIHLQANVARFERPPIQSSHLPQQSKRATPVTTSFASAVKGIQPTSVQPFSVPTLVLDDSCLVTRDLEYFVMGEVHQFSSINNLRVMLHNEGFQNVEIAYLGGLWVMLKLGSAKANLNLMKHVGVASWFVCLCNAQSDFVANERIVWVDIEGVPLYVWSRNTFQKIGSKWGEVMELEEGKVFRIHAKELFVWSPSFKEIPEMVYYPDDESVKEDVDNKVEDGSLNKVEDESDTDTDVVSDTYFGDNAAKQDCVNEVDQLTKVKEVSYDPLNIYDLLNKGNTDTGNSGVESSIPYPPGFTPDKVVHAQEDQNARGEDVMQSNSRSDDCNSRVFEEMEKPEVCLSSDGRDSRALRKKGGSILDVIDEMIKGLGSKAKKEWIRELTIKHKNGESIVMGDFNEVRKKLQLLKKEIRIWVADYKKKQTGRIQNLKDQLRDIDILLDQGGVTDDNLLSLEGDENSQFFHDRFNDPGLCRGKLNFSFPNRFSIEQAADLEIMVSNDEIRNAVWGCGENKSPRPDGFTFEFFRCNSSFVTLIPKILEPKLVSDFRHVSLIGSIYKVVTKILASRLSNVISELISNVQTAFLPNRQILDRSFIVNEMLSRCIIKNQKAMIFKGDPLAPFLFILIMESLHLSFSRAVEAGISSMEIKEIERLHGLSGIPFLLLNSMEA
nr:hypothetical protein [Tanacetum cinerariifolium]